MTRQGRIVLVTGLPAGLGASTVALALADALAGMGRGVMLVGRLSSLGDVAPDARPARQLGPALVLPQTVGPDLVPLDLCDEALLPQALSLLAREADFVLVDRFTGLSVKDSPWFRAAGEILLLVDGRPGMDTRSLLLAGHVLRHWPDKALHLLHNRMDGPFNWQTMSARFQRRVLRHHGVLPLDLGCLPQAPEIARATREGKAFSRMYANHPGARQIRQVARQLLRLGLSDDAPARRQENAPMPATWIQP